MQRAEISIHALREEGDQHPMGNRAGQRKFLSTPSVRRATDVYTHVYPYWIFLSTPSVRRATFTTESEAVAFIKFLSTPSVRRATPEPFHLAEKIGISIHALREEGDAA